MLSGDSQVISCLNIMHKYMYSCSDDGVRAPIPQKQETLVEDNFSLGKFHCFIAVYFIINY